MAIQLHERRHIVFDPYRRISGIGRNAHPAPKNHNSRSAGKRRTAKTAIYASCQRHQSPKPQILHRSPLVGTVQPHYLLRIHFFLSH